jgi:hypothetical protein
MKKLRAFWKGLSVEAQANIAAVGFIAGAILAAYLCRLLYFYVLDNDDMFFPVILAIIGITAAVTYHFTKSKCDKLMKEKMRFMRRMTNREKLEEICKENGVKLKILTYDDALKIAEERDCTVNHLIGHSIYEGWLAYWLVDYGESFILVSDELDFSDYQLHDALSLIERRKENETEKT